MKLPLPHLHSGKVRDIYDAGGGRLLLVASDRLSAFDVVMAEPVPDKGRVLTAMTHAWMTDLAGLVPFHLLSVDPADFPAPLEPFAGDLAGRTMLVRRVDILPIECIVRAYLAGSAWQEYRTRGTVHREPAPAGLREAERFERPRFTPSTKASSGSHDENISFAAAADLIGADLAEQVRDASLRVFTAASAAAERAGFLLADTKFEFGLDADGTLVLADEILTPDSSRFWLATDWSPGATPVGFDKQPVRDFLTASGWDRTPPPPHLPPEVITATRTRYIDAYERVTGRSFAAWPGRPLPSESEMR